MERWLRIALFATIIGISKATHIIKLVILAGLGLAGLWMVHTLAQDYQNILGHSGGGGNSREGLEDPKYFAKRSANDQEGYPQTSTHIEIDWERILSRDPASCAMSFVCQLEAQTQQELSLEESNILNLIRYSSENESWANNKLKEALRNGKKVKSPVECKKFYRFCPYSSKMMMNLLRWIGGR